MLLCPQVPQSLSEYLVNGAAYAAKIGQPMGKVNKAGNRPKKENTFLVKLHGNGQHFYDIFIFEISMRNWYDLIKIQGVPKNCSSCNFLSIT